MSMANYWYGTYGEFGETISQNAAQSGTVGVYVGTAPVHLIRGWQAQNLVNAPVQLFNYADALRKVGYSNDWGNYSICEAISAHFNNSQGNIGPIMVINVLDPSIHKVEEPVTQQIGITNGRGEFPSADIILDTFAIEDKVEGVDYALDYNYTKGTVVVTSLSQDDPLPPTTTVNYSLVQPAAITEAEIIGGITAQGVYSGLGVISRIYGTTYKVINLLAAPGWSHIPAVYHAMIAASQQINGHWMCFSLADIPVLDSVTGEAPAAVDTIDSAKAWKTAHAYTSELSKVFWPQAQDAIGRVFHLSTLAMVTMMRTDAENGNVPMETPGNKPIPIVRQYFGENSANQGFDEQTGNQLTSFGISTTVVSHSQWVLWGDHTAAYIHEATSDPRVFFDTNIRMMMHVVNQFQIEWSPQIDEPMTRALVDQVINREQEKLDGWVAIGALIGKPRIEFVQLQNPIENIVNGDFRWDIQLTPTPPFKSARAVVRYTTEGFSVYYEGGQAA